MARVVATKIGDETESEEDSRRILSAGASNTLSTPNRRPL